MEGLGAEQVIDVDRRPMKDAVGQVDLVLEPVGGELARRSWPLVKPGGAFVTWFGNGGGASRSDVRWVCFVVEVDRAELAELRAGGSP